MAPNIPAVPQVSTTPAESSPPTGVGTEIIRCSVELPLGYNLMIDRSGECPQPKEYNSTASPSFYISKSSGNLYAEYAKIAASDSSVTYDGCRKNTRYTDSLPGGVGTTVCFYGQGVIAAVTEGETKQDSGAYATVDLVVWRSP